MSIQTAICPVPNCPAIIAKGRLMCAEHWKLVPKDLKHEVWAEYKDSKRGFVNYGKRREAIRVAAAAEQQSAAVQQNLL
jgi:hypothetical protein